MRRDIGANDTVAAADDESLHGDAAGEYLDIGQQIGLIGRHLFVPNLVDLIIRQLYINHLK